MLGKLVQTAITLSTPVSSSLCVVIRRECFMLYFEVLRFWFHCIVALAFVNQGHIVEIIKLEYKSWTNLGIQNAIYVDLDASSSFLLCFL